MNIDIYAISARVENHVATSNMDLTPVGRVLCNSYPLVLKELYDFADILSDEDGDKLRHILNKSEGMPAYVIEICTPKECEDEQE
jgi:hypothetical protein